MGTTISMTTTVEAAMVEEAVEAAMVEEAVGAAVMAEGEAAAAAEVAAAAARAAEVEAEAATEVSRDEIDYLIALVPRIASSASGSSSADRSPGSVPR